MKSRDEAIAASRGKIAQASHDLARVHESATSRRGFPADEGEFKSNLSAFISSTRSALLVIARHEGLKKLAEERAKKGGRTLEGRDERRDDWQWSKDETAMWATLDVAIYDHFRDVRNKNEHEGALACESVIREMNEWELPPDDRHPLDPPRTFVIVPWMKPLKVQVPEFTMEIGGRTMRVCEAARRYLELVNLAVERYAEAQAG